MKRLFRALCAFVFFICFFALFSLSASCAEASVSIPEEEWTGFAEAVPEEVSSYFPDGALEDGESYARAIEKMTEPKNIVSALLELSGVVLVSAVLSAVGAQSENPTLCAVMRFCSLGALFCSVGYTFYSHFERLEIFFERIALLVNGMIPVTASLWALGGNVSTASAGSATLYCFLTVIEKLWAASAIPIFVLLIMLGFCDVLCSELRTGRVVGTVKRVYGFFLGLSMTVLLSSLAAQTALTAVADGVSARAGRLVSSTVIPIVGGNLGEALRTVASSVTYLKSIFGVGGIVMIALLTLPMAISVLLTRFVFGVCSALADIIGCTEEARLLNAFSEAYGCMLAVVCGVGMMFVLSLCIFMKTAVAAA